MRDGTAFDRVMRKRENDTGVKIGSDACMQVEKKSGHSEHWNEATHERKDKSH